MTLIRKACFVMHISVHFLSRERKRNQKKPPVPRSLLRVGTADGARRNSLALRQADALIPSAPPMLGAAQRENRKIRMGSFLKSNIRIRRIGNFQAVGFSAAQPPALKHLNTAAR